MNEIVRKWSNMKRKGRKIEKKGLGGNRLRREMPPWRTALIPKTTRKLKLVPGFAFHLREPSSRTSFFPLAVTLVPNDEHGWHDHINQGPHRREILQPRRSFPFHEVRRDRLPPCWLQPASRL